MQRAEADPGVCAHGSPLTNLLAFPRLGKAGIDYVKVLAIVVRQPLYELPEAEFSAQQQGDVIVHEDPFTLFQRKPPMDTPGS